MAVVKEARMNSLRQNLDDITVKLETTNNDDFENRLNNHLVVSGDNLREAFQQVRPSGLREVAIDVPNVNIIFKCVFLIVRAVVNSLQKR